MKRYIPPYLLSGPAIILFVVMLAVPMFMTFLLSFKSFSFYTGITPDYGWHNYLEVISDSYFHEIFFRTYAISIGVTFLCALIGAPEAYILSRMTKAWRSMCFWLFWAPC
jgi:putative spermidine/putrescine transport system permease protein